jgi:hypothetical protein
MSLSGDITTKKRKVHYDTYTRGFYMETRVEALQRQVEYRGKMTGVRNKSEDARLSLAKKQVEGARYIFNRKNNRELSEHKENLTTTLAYKRVLGHIARDRDRILRGEENNYGRYGEDSSRSSLEVDIAKEAREMSGFIKRKRDAERLLSHRKKLEVFDRTLATPEMYRAAQSKRSRSVSPVNRRRRKSSQRKIPTPKLILPPITVRLRREDSGPRVTDSVSQAHSQRPNQSASLELPSVFVTQHSDAT